MQDVDDIELLRRYARDGSEEAFAMVSSRHLNLVYSVALRHLGDPHQAEEINQAVFVILPEKRIRCAKGFSFPAGCTRPPGLSPITSGKPKSGAKAANRRPICNHS